MKFIEWLVKCLALNHNPPRKGRKEKEMDEKIKRAVESYQCIGCVCGGDTTCYEKGDNEACKKHVSGTFISFIGNIYLGMPKGFNRLGPCRETKINIFRELKDGWKYDTFNIPVWKHKDEHGNVIVRGLSPRTNSPFIHIFLVDCIMEINCMEITAQELSKMD